MKFENNTRRTFLQQIGAAGVVGGTVSMAGCTASDEDDIDREGELGNPVPEINLLAQTASANPNRNELARMVADNWREIGFEVDIEELQFGAHVERKMVEHDFDASILSWGGSSDRIDPHVFLYELHHSSNTDPGQWNNVGYENPEFDEIAEKQLSTTDEEERQKFVYEAQEILARDQPRTYVAFEDGNQPYASSRVDNVNPTLGEGFNSFWNLISVNPIEGDTVSFGYPAELVSLNMMQDISTPGRQFIGLIYDRLFRIGPEGIPQPWMATDLPEVEDEGLTHTIELRDNLTFHDGEPVTGEDIRFTFETYSESAIFADDVERIDEVVINGNEITFHISDVYSPFTSNVLSQLNIIPEHIWQEADMENLADFEDPNWIGSGPFEFEDWERQQELQLRANEDHFETPNAERLIRVAAADASQLFNDLEAGSIDIVGWVPQPATQGRIEDNPDLALEMTTDIGFVEVEYNIRRDLFKDTNVRRALAHGVPKQDFVDIVLGGQGTLTHTPIAPHIEFWHNPEVEEFYEDLDTAREILANAGFGWDEDDRIHYLDDE